MPIYHTMGQIPRKRHIAFRRPDGGLYAEELMGHEGFTGTSSLLYHTHPPTTVKSVRRLREIKYEADPDQTLRHRHLRTSHVKRGGSPTLDRIPLLFNQDIAMLYVEPDENDAHFYRNAQADELVYVAKGTGTLESVFGDLPYREGDYLVIHRGIMHRWRLDLSTEPTKLLIMESRGHVRWPKRYRNEFGQLIEGAPYSERDIRRPSALRIHDERADSTRSSWTTIRSTSWAGTATSIRGRSTSTISSRSSAGYTSRRRCTRPSRATGSSSAASVPGRTIFTPRRCPRRTTTATWTRTRCCTTPRASS